jgi:hypothetical protein
VHLHTSITASSLTILTVSRCRSATYHRISAARVVCAPCITHRSHIVVATPGRLNSLTYYSHHCPASSPTTLTVHAIRTLHTIEFQPFRWSVRPPSLAARISSSWPLLDNSIPLHNTPITAQPPAPPYFWCHAIQTLHTIKFQPLRWSVRPPAPHIIVATPGRLNPLTGDKVLDAMKAGMAWLVSPTGAAVSVLPSLSSLTQIARP